MSDSRRNDQRVFDPDTGRFRERQCRDCCEGIPRTIYGHVIERRIYCIVHDSMKDPDDMACVDFVKVS